MNMDITKLYEIGRAIPLGFSIKSDQKKLDFIRFKYSSKEIINTALACLAGIFLLSQIIGFIADFLQPAGQAELIFIVQVIKTVNTAFTFLGAIACAVLYIYPVHIFYSKEIQRYNEQMLRAILSMTNFISMRTSFEYAFIETTKQIKGVLRMEFEEIGNMIQRKEKIDLGHAFEDYLKGWVEINPVFVKSLRLLQTALMAEEKDRDNILQETIRTLMINFKIQGKRNAEELAGKAKNLVSFGVLLPVTSLMLLPLFSVFLSDFIKPSAMVFAFNVLFPIVILLMALDFANKRLQIDTIDLEASPDYQTIPVWIYGLCGLIVMGFSIPGILHLISVDLSTPASAEVEYQFMSVFNVWLITLGFMIAIYIISRYYIHLHQELWKDVKETEDDLPHLLQILSTYLSLSISMENIIPRVEKDYLEEGFPNHPVVRIFREVSRKLMGSKEKMTVFIQDILRKVCPSVKVTNILNMIISFSTISLPSATKAAKLSREQSISIIELDDYIRTLLSETVALIGITITMLMPLLSAVSVIMSLVIVKSLTFIGQVLSDIGASFGAGSMLDLSLVDVTKILPPTYLEVIVGFYFIEMFLVLSLFSTKIEIGDDKFKLAKTINSNMMGYVIYSIILLAGHYLMMEIFFKGMLA